MLYAREGAKVFAVDNNAEAVEETRSIIEDEGGACVSHLADITDAGQVEAMVARCVESFGGVGILHNNVGIVELGGPVETSEESWDRVCDVNLKSMFLTCKSVLPHMERQGGGAIVNISSIVGIRYLGVPYISYSTTKAAIIQFTQTVALQYAEKNIRANAILPGLMNTPMIVEPLKDAYGDGDVDKMIEVRNQQCPMKKMGDAWDVAYAALFLASDEADFITGQVISPNGGERIVGI
mgnify:CR=1 FL=1